VPCFLPRSLWLVRLWSLCFPHPRWRFLRLPVGENGRSQADGSLPFDEGALHTPVLLGRERTIGSCGVGPGVVDQGDTVSDEDVVFHGYAFAGEGAAGDLAAISELHIFFEFLRMRRFSFHRQFHHHKGLVNLDS